MTDVSLVDAAARSPLPATPYIEFGEDGSAHLAGSHCRECGEVHLGARMACPNCARRDGLEAIRLSERGRLYAYTIVARSFPGISVPFIAATVDLDGGGTVKGNLVGVPADPASLPFDMPVRVVFRDAGKTDAAGNRYMSYVFVPDEGGVA